MLFDRGLGQVSKAAGGVVRRLTLDSPEGWLTAENVSLSRDGAMKVSTVSRCVDLRSSSMAVLPVFVMDEGSKEHFQGHRLGNLLWGSPNEAMTRFDYEKLMSCNKYLCGNAYAWIRRSAVSAAPLELIPLPPECVTPYVTPAGKLWYVFFHPVTGETTWLPPEDILHYKEYSEDGIEGISILHRAAQTIQTARSAQQYEKDMYDNGGQPSGVLTAEGDLGGEYEIRDAEGKVVETITKKERLRREWEKVHRGPGNRFRTAVLDLGLKYQTIAMNNTDAQFVESKDIRVADVCRFFGTPLHLVYAGKQSYNSNEQNAIEFVTYTLQPDATQREQEDSRKLLLPSERAGGLRIKRNLKVFLRGDTAAQAAWYRTMRATGPYSVNDILALEDMPSVPGGDSRYASWNYGPLEQFERLSVIRALGGKAPEEKKGETE